MAGPTLSQPRPLLRPGALAALVTRLRARVPAIGIETSVVALLMVTGLAMQGVNLFHYPALGRFDDEGIYTAQAWAVLREARLSPYTYIYDHAPAGWILLAGWMGLTGGPHGLFGNAIDSGRVLILLLHLAMIPLLYHLARKLGCGVTAAAFATALFSLSPLAIVYQRPVLLDTIMLFWILLSLDLLLDGSARLSRLVLSGVCFGLALLSKETALFLLPAMLFIAVQQRRQHQGAFAVGGWLLPMLIVISWYPLFALIKEELLGAGSSFLAIISGTGRGDNVSLVETLRWQASRGGGGMFNLENQFWQLVRSEWLPRDPLLVLGGAIAVDLNLLRGIAFGSRFNRRAFAAGLLGVLPLLYLARGGIVFDFYILFAIPFLCLNLGVALAPLLARLPARVGGALATAAVAAIAAGYLWAGTLQPLYAQQPDATSRQAIAWIKTHLPADSLIVAGDAFWTDLREPGLGGPAFTGIHSHWKVASDPDVRDRIFGGDWRTVDYLIMSPILAEELDRSGNTLALEAFRNAHLVKRWEADGYFTELWKVDQPGTTEAALLAASAASIGRAFEREGAYVDPGGVVTSEAQSYAMLRAAWSGDRAGFDRAWGWTRTHLINADGLLAWKWRDGATIDANTATDADSDVALALLLAGQRWNDPALREAGAGMVRAIWAQEVVTLDGKPYLTAGNWATQGQVIVLNPSYFSPYAYAIFQEVDPDHNWYALIDTGYQVLADASLAPLGAPRSAGLPPDWVGLDRASGRLVPVQLDRGQGDTTRYGYDAVRTYWRVALHLRWNYDGRAEAYLRGAGFLRDEVTYPTGSEGAVKGYVGAVYAHDGTPLEEAPSLAGNAGALAALLTLDPGAANTLYTRQFIGGVTAADGSIYWGDPNDIYAQEWAWFAIALYADALPNLWTDPAAR